MRVLLFDHADRRYGLDTSRVVEVLPAVRWRPLEGTPAWTLGLFERQERLLPLVDLAILLGGPPTLLRAGSRIVVSPLSDDDAALGGLLLEATAGLEEIDFDAEGGFAAGEDHFGPVARHGGTTVRLLRPDRLLDRDAFARLFGEAA